MDVKSQQELSKRLVIFYGIALSAIAFFSLGSQILIQHSIRQHQNDATVVNVAGRQRMLSQKITKMAILLVRNEIISPNAELYYSELDSTLNLWRACHEGLKSGSLFHNNRHYYVNNSVSIDSLFNIVQPAFETIFKYSKIIAALSLEPKPDMQTTLDAALRAVLANEHLFLSMMDKIVFQYDREASERVEKLKLTEWVLFGCTMVILLLEAFFIFKPTYKQIKETIRQISTSEQEQILLNQALKETNFQLHQARFELARASEERMRLKMLEDKERSLAIISGQEEERKRLAAELHDGIGQMLTGLKLLSEKLSLTAFQNEKDQAAFTQMKQLLENTITETRRVAYNLMPSVLNDFGLVEALKLLCSETEKESGIKTNFDTNLSSAALAVSKSLALSLYRICQEALTNCLKHAEATNIFVRLNKIKTKNGMFLEMTIQDDGKGMDAKKLAVHRSSNGLHNMKHRIELHGGTFSLQSEKTKGTKVLIKVPVTR